MTKQYSIAAAREQLPGIVHEVEAGQPVELTRRGRRVAVLMSVDEYERLLGRSSGFGDRLLAFRRRLEAEGVEIPRETFEGLRDRSPGREFSW
ncbi:MAG: type II toxin-antitoxin system Phd/YefM family antitoxin [Chloroflexi bacterium]|nr:type II toxin-antitoxin system Phd/YefM family antitoxin [Chloroflexota bacterium]